MRHSDPRPGRCSLHCLVRLSPFCNEMVNDSDFIVDQWWFRKFHSLRQNNASQTYWMPTRYCHVSMIYNTPLCNENASVKNGWYTIIMRCDYVITREKCTNLMRVALVIPCHEISNGFVGPTRFICKDTELM